jgi:hypothetical protein
MNLTKWLMIEKWLTYALIFILGMAAGVLLMLIEVHWLGWAI